jgi:hypothetical protein
MRNKRYPSAVQNPAFLAGFFLSHSSNCSSVCGCETSPRKATNGELPFRIGCNGVSAPVAANAYTPDEFSKLAAEAPK